MPDWSSVLEITLPPGELILRGTLSFLALLALMRIIGQRESGGLGLTDILLVVLVAEAAAPGLYGDAESIGDTLLLVSTILFWSVAVDAVSYRWPAVGRVLKARPKELVRDGKIDHKALRRELMTPDELASVLRLQGIDDVSVVHVARIEPNGMISIIRRDHGETHSPEPPIE